MPEGAQSPADDSNKKQLGHSTPGNEGAGAQSDAQQRPAVSGQQEPKKEDQPGSKESGGGEVTDDAIAQAKKSAKALESENGQSRKEVETGGKAA